MGVNSLDYLYLDGDHTHEGVKKDFEMYTPLVKDNGIIALHDIVPDLIHSDIDVNKFWNNVKEKYSFKELVENWNQSGQGIGLLTKTSKN